MVTVNIMPKRLIMSASSPIPKICAHCGIEFHAERSTARFHSDACKVAYHREKKANKEAFLTIAGRIRNIAYELEGKETSYSAAITLDSVRRTLDMYFPPKTRWWRCDACGKSVMKFLPDAKDCGCEGKAKWYIQVL
jgi:hypothetical protein